RRRSPPGPRPSGPPRPASPASAGASARLRAEPGAGTAGGLALIAGERAIDLVPQVADVDVDAFGVTFVCEVPDVLDQLGPGQDLAGVTHQVLEEGELPRRPLRRAPVARHAPL